MQCNSMDGTPPFFLPHLPLEVVGATMFLCTEAVFDDTTTLLNPKPAPKKFFALGKAIWQDLGEACHGLKIAHHARLKSGSTCSRGDVVLAASATGFDAGEVACFLSKDNQDVCILHIFSLKEKLPKHCVWEEMQSQEGVPLSAILAPVFHCKSKRGVTTLTPWQWQWQDQFQQKKKCTCSMQSLGPSWMFKHTVVIVEAHSAGCLSTQCWLLEHTVLFLARFYIGFSLWHIDGNNAFLFTFLLPSIQCWHSTSIV